MWPISCGMPEPAVCRKRPGKRDASFYRWLFGGRVHFPVTSKTSLNLILAFLTLLALGVIGVLSTIIAALYLFPLSRAIHGPALDLLRRLTWVAGIYTAVPDTLWRTTLVDLPR